MKRAWEAMETMVAVLLLAGALHAGPRYAEGVMGGGGGERPATGSADAADAQEPTVPADTLDDADTGETPEAAGDATTPEAPRNAGGKTGSGARLFESWEAAVEGGLLTPVGDLADVLDPAPLLGLRLTTSYYRAWRAATTLSGAWLDGAESPVPVAWIAGAAGLEWRPPRPWLPAPGAALALYYVRATEVRTTDDDGPGDEYLFLEDGESEFGFQAGLRWHLPLSRQLGLAAGIRWDLMFTRPSLSHAASAAVGASWTP